MAILIPDFSTYSNEDLLAIAETQTQAYLDSYNALALISENPASDAVSNFFTTMGSGIEIEMLSQAQASAISLSEQVQVQQSGQQDKFDYAEAFCFEWFHRFYPTNSFTEFKSLTLSQNILYDSGTDTISVNNI